VKKVESSSHPEPRTEAVREMSAENHHVSPEMMSGHGSQFSNMDAVITERS
jgi:hypothetical protein